MERNEILDAMGEVDNQVELVSERFFSMRPVSLSITQSLAPMNAIKL
jgi:hypothetical protein